MLDAGFELEFFQGGTTTDVLSIQIAAAGTRQARLRVIGGEGMAQQ